MLLVFDYLIVLRPTLLIPVWTLVLVGYYHAGQFDASARPGFNWCILSTICLYSMLSGGCYIVNQIADRETDEVNGKLYLIERGYVRIPILKLEATILILGAIIWSILLFRNNIPYLVLIAISIVLGLMYSVRPIRLKGKPIIDLIANAIGYGCVAFLIGWVSVLSISLVALQSSIPYVFCVAAAFVNTTLPDLSGDRSSNDLTTGILLGVRYSCQFSLALLVCAILASLWMHNSTALITTMICLPFFVYMNFKREIKTIILSTRIGILVLSLIVCIHLPMYAILFVSTIFLVRWYYAARFGIKYP